MKCVRLVEGPLQSWLLVGEPNEDVMESLATFASKHDLTAAHLTAIGGFRRADLGYFDVQERRYQPIEVDEQSELLSMVGDIATYDGRPKVHAHVVLGLRDGRTRGGHLMSGIVRPTIEVVITESPAHLRRSFNPEFGIPLIDVG